MKYLIVIEPFRQPAIRLYTRSSRMHFNRLARALNARRTCAEAIEFHIDGLSSGGRAGPHAGDVCGIRGKSPNRDRPVEGDLVHGSPIFGHLQLFRSRNVFLRRTPKPKVCAVISIHGCREFGVEADVTRRLDLTFDDVEVGLPNDLVAASAEFESEAMGQAKRHIQMR